MLSVSDVGGRVGSSSSAVRVVTPEQAVGKIIGQLDAAIAGAADMNVRRNLERERRAQAGSNGQSNNGALSMMRAGNKQAATAFLQQTINRLRKAQAGGADVALQLALLEQVVAALSAA